MFIKIELYDFNKVMTNNKKGVVLIWIYEIKLIKLTARICWLHICAAVMKSLMSTKIHILTNRNRWIYRCIKNTENCI